MAFTVTADGNAILDLAPKTLIKEIAQNISMILTTPKYTVPLDRNFGLSARFVDKPTPVSEAMIVAEVLDAIEKYEQRVNVLNVSFTRDDMTGKVIPRVEVEIIERE